MNPKLIHVALVDMDTVEAEFGDAGEANGSQLDLGHEEGLPLERDGDSFLNTTQSGGHRRSNTGDSSHGGDQMVRFPIVYLP